MKFGISPFGVWRNKADDPLGSDTKAGATNYDHLYANVIKWQEKGWIDYLLPQLYWQIGHPAVDFNLMANWWKLHAYERAMYIGHGAYKSYPASSTVEWAMPEQLPQQINLLRKIPEIGGSAFYSSKHFRRDLMGFQDSLKNSLYKQPAIIPPMPWLDDSPPKKVKRFRKRWKKIKWKTVQTTDALNQPNQFIIYLNEKGKRFDPENQKYIHEITHHTKYKFERINRRKKKYEVRIGVLDRLNNESDPSKPVEVKL